MKIEAETDYSETVSRPRDAGRPFLWNCLKCKRNRRTNFCQDCGTSKPDEQSNDEKSLNDIRMLSAHCRKVSQGKWNAYQTALERGHCGERERESYLKHKKFADAADWALSILS